jgi:hypothetical protein
MTMNKAARTHLVTFPAGLAEATRQGIKTSHVTMMRPQPVSLGELKLLSGTFTPISVFTERLKAATKQGLHLIPSHGPFTGHATPHHSHHVGDTLLLRETHRILMWNCNGNWRIGFLDGGHIDISGGLFMDDEDGHKENRLLDQLTDYCESHGYDRCSDDDGEFDVTDRPMPWRPASALWTKAVRTRLEVTGCEGIRLRDITPEQAIAQGMRRIDVPEHGTYYANYLNSMVWLVSPVESFFTMWDRIHGQGASERNPAVWVTTYRMQQ